LGCLSPEVSCVCVCVCVCTPALRCTHPARVPVTCSRYILCSRPTQTCTYMCTCTCVFVFEYISYTSTHTHTRTHARKPPPPLNTHAHRALRRAVPWRFLARYAEIHPDPHPNSIMTAGRVERSSGISCRGGCVCVCLCVGVGACARVCVCVCACVCAYERERERERERV
jgi:hypothetical protein